MKVFALGLVIGCLAVQALPAQEQKSSSTGQKPQISTLPAKIGQPTHQAGSASSKPGSEIKTARVARQASTTEKPKDDQKVPHILIDSQDSKSRPVRDTHSPTTENPNTQKAPHLLGNSNPHTHSETKNSRPVRDTHTSTTEDPKEPSAVAHLLQASQRASARQARDTQSSSTTEDPDSSSKTSQNSRVARQTQDSSINSKSTDNRPSQDQNKPAINPAVLTKDVPKDSIKTAQH